VKHQLALVMLPILLAQAASPAGAAPRDCATRRVDVTLQKHADAAKHVAVDVQLRLYKTRSLVEHAQSQAALVQRASAGSALDQRALYAIQEALAEVKQAEREMAVLARQVQSTWYAAHQCSNR